MKLAAKAVVSLKWKLDAVDEKNGLVSFTTGMTWGSWSGVSGSLLLQEDALFRFTVTGSAKQNVKGGQMVALNLFDEAGKKVQKIIDEMSALAS
ncbi:hypothetical protein NX862_01670 [Rhodobacter sp. KR11]|nr:hypothetical protein [Rhodobacter sp. KR11]